MIENIIEIAFLCITIGAASIPVSFEVNNDPIVVWLGNALGSLLSAIFVIYVGNRITDENFKQKMSKRRVGKKVVTVFEEGDSNKKVQKVRVTINKRGLRLFSFLTPVFPGVLISTVAVFLLGLDLHTYKKWMFTGIFFASGAYVFGYWIAFVR